MGAGEGKGKYLCPSSVISLTWLKGTNVSPSLGKYNYSMSKGLRTSDLIGSLSTQHRDRENREWELPRQAFPWSSAGLRTGPC